MIKTQFWLAMGIWQKHQSRHKPRQLPRQSASVWGSTAELQSHNTPHAVLQAGGIVSGKLPSRKETRSASQQLAEQEPRCSPVAKKAKGNLGLCQE